MLALRRVVGTPRRSTWMLIRGYLAFQQDLQVVSFFLEQKRTYRSCRFNEIHWYRTRRVIFRRRVWILWTTKHIHASATRSHRKSVNLLLKAATNDGKPRLWLQRRLCSSVNDQRLHNVRMSTVRSLVLCRAPLTLHDLTIDVGVIVVYAVAKLTLIRNCGSVYSTNST